MVIAKRQEDLHNGHSDYLVYAGSQNVGRLYQTHLPATRDQWFWDVNAVTFDMSLGAVIHGYARDLDDAKEKLRMAFDEWLGAVNDFQEGALKSDGAIVVCAGNDHQFGRVCSTPRG